MEYNLSRKSSLSCGSISQRLTRRSVGYSNSALIYRPTSNASSAGSRKESSINFFLVAQGAQLASRPVETVMSRGIVATILWDDASVESVVMNEGFLEKLGTGGVHISMTSGLARSYVKSIVDLLSIEQRQD